MRVIYCQVIPALCLGLMIGACSSSDGALPDLGVGSSGTNNETGTMLSGELDNGNTGSAGSAVLAHSVERIGW